jgi:hypothetical protein
MLTLDCRRVFPEADWQRYAWDPADPRTTYTSFLEGIEGKNRPNFEPTDNLMVWHFPKRGTTPGLDKLLTCLVFLSIHPFLNLTNYHTRNLELRMR